MISQLLKEKILELTKKEELCSQVLTRIRLKKEKLILLLYEEENNLELFQDTELDSLTSLRLLDQSIENLTNDSKELTRQLQTGIVLSESAARVCKDEQEARSGGGGVPPLEPTEQEARSGGGGVPPLEPTEQEAVAKLILDQIKKMQLWSFGTTYMAQVLDLKPGIVSQGLHLESYSRFWQLKKKAKTDVLSIWITDLDLINSLFAKSEEQKVLSVMQLQDKARIRRNSFKRSLPPNSTNDLVEKSSSIMDLLNRVFDSNRGKQLDAMEILNYLYPGQTKDWSKQEKRSRAELVSRELSTSIKKGNWRRISTGVYTHV